MTIGQGRRLAHLLRAKRKEITKAEPVRCILDSEHNAEEISLAENVIRSAMHPADQFEAFDRLHREEGMAAEDIAARFGVSPTVVWQRLKLGAVMLAIAERHEAWERRMPEDEAELWTLIEKLDQMEQIELLAHCTSLTVNVMQVRNGTERAALAHANVLAETLALDRTTTWKPTVTSYRGRVSKERILDAVREGVSPEAADNIAGMKKQAMAETAERRLAGTGWLPELLRTCSATDAVPLQV